MILNNTWCNSEGPITELALHGYATYTTLLVEQGGVRGLQYHLQRLVNDARVLFGTAPSKTQLLSNLRAFLESTDSTNHQIVRVTVFPQSFSLAEPGSINELNILVNSRASLYSPQQALRVVLINAERVWPLQKTANMIVNLKARAQAQAKGFNDALMVKNDFITEGSTWNVFFIKDRQLLTPPIGEDVLPGVTRRIVIELAQQAGIEVLEVAVKPNDIGKFDAALATNATVGLRDIIAINGHSYSNQSYKSHSYEANDLAKQLKMLYNTVERDII